MRSVRGLRACCVAVLLASFAAAAAPPVCPESHWAVQYAAWRAAEGANASRLTWITTDASPGGWGDRMRGSLLALRVAAANNRTLYLRWGGLHALGTYLQPATFDWRPATNSCLSDECDAASGARLVLDRGMGRLAGTSTSFDGELATALASDGEVVIDERRSASQLLPLSGAATMEQEVDFVCAWEVLYMPTAELAARGEAVLAALNVTRPYAAVHLRLGGLEGERKALSRVKDAPSATSCPLTLARAAASCAAALRDAGNSSSSKETFLSNSGRRRPVLVITDNEALRAKLARGKVEGATGPSYSAEHVSLAAHARARAGKRWDAWVDVYLLANAAQLLTSHSGFSNMAAWWSNARTVDVATCVRADAGFEAACARERKRGVK